MSLATAPASPEKAPETPRDIDLGLPLRILLAEDNAVNQLLMVKFLERWHQHATVVETGTAVLAELAQHPYDVVFLDICMPELDGIATAQAIRQLPLDPQPYLIALTANALPSDRNQCLAAGMNDYLSKPIRPETLLSALQAAETQLILNWPTQTGTTQTGTTQTGTTQTEAIQTEAQPSASETTHPEHTQFIPSALPLLNRQRLDASLFAMGDQWTESLGLLTQIYQEESPRLLQMINDHLSPPPHSSRPTAPVLEDYQRDQLRYAAHTLKSSSLLLGAEALADLCQTLETQSSQGSREELQPWVTPLQQTYTATLQALQTLLV